MNLHVEHHNIKPTLTAHGFNGWSEAQKVWYFIKGINTNIDDTCLSNISRSEALRDDFAVAARHVVDFCVIINSRDPDSNCNILGVDTDRGGGDGRVRGGGSGCGGRFGGDGFSHGRGGHGVLPQDVINACTHITKFYYPVDQYSRFSAS